MNKIEILTTALEYIEANLSSEIKTEDVAGACYCSKAALEKLRLSHRNYFFAHNKSLGWDVFDFRYGGIITRTETAIYQLGEYLAGRTDRLEELEVERLNFNSQEGIPFYMWHNKVMSPTTRILG